jgi:hypothetical protein
MSFSYTSQRIHIDETSEIVNGLGDEYACTKAAFVTSWSSQLFARQQLVGDGFAIGVETARNIVAANR